MNQGAYNEPLPHSGSNGSGGRSKHESFFKKGDHPDFKNNNDGAGNTYFTEGTRSNPFPATAGANVIQPLFKGGYFDAFIAKFDKDARDIWATYYGGSEWDEGKEIALNSNDDIYLVGSTASAVAWRLMATIMYTSLVRPQAARGFRSPH
ncbi:MAG: hypothetical protein IH946_11950 [Bacteroidetes bacterium]|nr:hypothetical protein [Bacteroidota bacterium]